MTVADQLPPFVQALCAITSSPKWCTCQHLWPSQGQRDTRGLACLQHKESHRRACSLVKVEAQVAKELNVFEPEQPCNARCLQHNQTQASSGKTDLDSPSCPDLRYHQSSSMRACPLSVNPMAMQSTTKQMNRPRCSILISPLSLFSVLHTIHGHEVRVSKDCPTSWVPLHKLKAYFTAKMLQPHSRNSKAALDLTHWIMQSACANTSFAVNVSRQRNYPMSRWEPPCCVELSTNIQLTNRLAAGAHAQDPTTSVFHKGCSKSLVG